MSQRLECDELVVKGRLGFERVEVTAAQLLAATPAGLLELSPSAGAMVIVEPTAVIRGVKLLGYVDPDTAIAPDETEDFGPDYSVTFTVVGDNGAITVTNEDPTMAAAHRLEVISASGGPDADGAIGRNPVVFSYNWNARRWRVPYSAP